MKRLYENLMHALLAPYFAREKYPSINERRFEYRFALDQLEGAQSVLDVGTGRSAWPHLTAMCGIRTVAIDEKSNYWEGRGFFNRHYPVETWDIVRAPYPEEFDAVTCISTLEHVSSWRQALDNMLMSGPVILTVPFGDNYVTNIANPPMLTQVFSRNELGEPLHRIRAPHGRFDVGCFRIQP